MEQILDNRTHVYKYRHVNGAVLTKTVFVVDTAGGPDQYFDSPYVVEWWIEERNDFEDFMTQVSKYIVQITRGSLTMSDLGDYHYTEAFAGRLDPEYVAYCALENDTIGSAVLEEIDDRESL